MTPRVRAGPSCEGREGVDGERISGLGWGRGAGMVVTSRYTELKLPRVRDRVWTPRVGQGRYGWMGSVER